jgi:N-acetyl-anhydromuramyl-L-alanine amidase AmpD
MRRSGSIVLLAAVVLQGCSNAAIQPPWARKANEGQSLLDLQDSLGAGRKQAMQASKSLDRPTKPPRLLEPEASGLSPVSQSQFVQCQTELGLPAEKEVLADPTNFGKRYTQDAWGRTIASTPLIIVLHETVLGAKETISFFQTPHPRDEDQASYHMLIDRDGSRLRIVPDDHRAYGAGMSAFGDVTQRVRPGSVGSINNVALHVSLVSPDDGRDDTDAHSGYTDEQYASLAGQVLLWQASYGIPLTRVTTHSAVDRSRSRYDPRSLRWDRFDAHYRKSAKSCGMSGFDTMQAGL